MSDSDIQNEISSANRRAEYAAYVEQGHREYMAKSDAVGSQIRTNPTPSSTNYGGGGSGCGSGGADFGPLMQWIFEGIGKIIAFPFVLLFEMIRGAVEGYLDNKVRCNAIIALVAVPLVGFTVWPAFNDYLKDNSAYVYGHRGTILINGRPVRVDVISADDMMYGTLAGRMRQQLGIISNFHLTRSAVITGTIQNVAIEGPGAIKIKGNVENSYIRAPHSLVYITGGVDYQAHLQSHEGNDNCHSFIQGYDVKVNGYCKRDRVHSVRAALISDGRIKTQ